MLDGTHGSSASDCHSTSGSAAAGTLVKRRASSSSSSSSSSVKKDSEELEQRTGNLAADNPSADTTAATTAITTTTALLRMRHPSNRGVSILPRIGNAERQEEDGNKLMMRKRFGWRWLLLGGTLLLLFVWLLGPRERRQRVLSVVYPHNSEDYEFDPPLDDPSTLTRLSFSTDPNPSSTLHCTNPYHAQTPLVQWALMIDAGSTGSRIHIYKFNNCGPSPAFEYEVFKMVQPGLSSFKKHPQAAAESLDPLMEEALRVVPEAFRHCAPVAVKATAGLRILGGEASQAILDKVRERLEQMYPFPVVRKDGVVIMDGKDEGVYAWITVNYLLGTIQPGGSKPTPPGGTYAVLDLGGASTQIVFEPSVENSKVPLEEGDHKYLLHFGSNGYVLYQHSYLGYGLMRARQSVHRLVDFMHALGANRSSDAQVANPCLAQGTSREVVIEDPPSECTLPDGQESKRNVTMVGADVGSFEACNRVIELVMAKHALCHVKPCSFNGVYQPSILDTFPTGQILLLLSYFYDRLSPLLPEGTTTLPISTLKTYAERICQGRTTWVKYWGDIPIAMEELEGRPEYCLDMTFMHALLRLGYEFGAERKVRIGKKVEETELGWCLGATIAMLEGGVECLV